MDYRKKYLKYKYKYKKLKNQYIQLQRGGVPITSAFILLLDEKFKTTNMPTVFQNQWN